MGNPFDRHFEATTIESRENGRNSNVYSFANECAGFDANVSAANSLTATTLIIGSADTS
jgi:hypothetical protein